MNTESVEQTDAKLAYAKPTLAELGDLKTHTLAGLNTSNGDGGSNAS